MSEDTDVQDIVQAPAPTGRDCRATIAGDARTVVDVWPPGAAARGQTGPAEWVSGYVIPGSDIQRQFDLVCPLFPVGVVAPVNELHQPCQEPTPPTTEIDQNLGSEAIAFRDPIGVSGTWDKMAGALVADGVVTFNPQLVRELDGPGHGASGLSPAASGSSSVRSGGARLRRPLRWTVTSPGAQPATWHRVCPEHPERRARR